MTSLSTQVDRSGVLWALSYLKDHDDAAFAVAVSRLPAAPRTRLQLLANPRSETLARTLSNHSGAAYAGQWVPVRERYLTALKAKSPVGAGVLSALVPGAGQAYAGSWQAAGIAFVLNAVFISATIELALSDLPVTAAAAGFVASFFYVGNVISAGQLANQRNRERAQPHYEQLERILVPEAHP